MGPYQKYLHKCDNESDVDLGGHVKERFLKLSRISTNIKDDSKAF